ncbi:MAG: amidase [Desulfovibrio sp.]|jgi:aspartyl-tRNA(Asn)/glutamyl-tRNA(Gln) amidotransferase subunit A|nr:amidase [Desulfovibrio sp.]
MTDKTDPGEMTALELGELFRSRKLSPVEAAGAALERIGRFNADVNAYCFVDESGALEAARKSEARFAAGLPLGPADGIPASIKDLTYAAGMPTRKGSLTVDPARNPDVDAPFAQRMREAGAVLLGKTTTPEFGWKGVTDSPVYGITRNPWNPERTSGGSSGGAAVAAALNMGVLHQGSDAGGSIRIPAGFCGVFGMKPGFGRIPQWPASAMTTLSHLGTLTRTVEDAALFLNIVARDDVRDFYRGGAFPADWRATLDLPLKGLRIAYSRTLGYASPAPDVLAAVDRAAAAAAGLGACVEEADPAFTDPAEAFNILWFAGAASILDGIPEAQRGRMDPGLLAVAREGAKISAAVYIKASAARAALSECMAAFHAKYDVLLTPALPLTAFAAGRNRPEGDPDGNWVDWTPYTYPFNMTQQPAASLPCGFGADGLPVGLAIVAAKHEDLLVMRVAGALEQALRPRFPSYVGEAVGSAGQKQTICLNN